MSTGKRKNVQSDNPRMKMVLDTTVLVSALSKAGKPRDLFNKLAKNKQIVLSRAILEEFLDVIEDFKVAKYTSEQDTTVFLEALGNAATIAQVKSMFKAVKEDPDNDIIEQAAYDGKADYIVSGDRHLLLLKEFKGIRILSVDEMLNI
jgi:putative PIN family toxin of toxin-antitoxin system